MKAGYIGYASKVLRLVVFFITPYAFSSAILSSAMSDIGN